jgi:sigma-B regulation protein RsbU (phosphoserine phosphatase)
MGEPGQCTAGNDLIEREKSVSDEQGSARIPATDMKMPSDSELLNTLLDNMPDTIYFKDLKSRFVRVNRFWLEKIGVKGYEEVVGKTDFDFFTPEHARQAYNDEQNIIATGQPMVGIEEKETWPDRPDTWVSTTKMPFRNKKGETLGTFGLSRDITEIKRYRDALQVAKDELEDRVRERTAELSEAKFRLEQNLEQLSYLNFTSYELVQIVDIEQLFMVIGTAFTARFPHAHVSICYKKKGAFSCVYATSGLNSSEGKALCEAALQPFLEQDLLSQVFVDNWRETPHLQLNWPAEVMENPVWIGFPLVADKKTLAIIQLFIPSQGETIFRQEQTLLSTLAAHAAACLSNAIHYKELESKARLEGELEAARNIQQSLTPQVMPVIPHVKIAGLYQPAYEVGGDYLDYFQCGDGSWAVMVADVCGKGVPAALLMTILRSVARVEARSHFSAKDLLCAINQSICCNINERSFITALCLVINPEGTGMTYARAGHNKLLKLNAAQGTILPVDSSGMALGIITEAEDFAKTLDEVALPLEPGNSFFAYTDGVSEAANASKDFYGLPRLLNVAARSNSGSADALLSGVLADVQSFVKNEQASDDITMFAMSVEGT